MEHHQPHDQQSGFLSQEDTDCYTGAAMRDVEVIATTATNIIAVGRRYGRQWFLKGLTADLRESTSMRRRLIKEFEIHSRLRHANIVQAVGFEEIEGLGPCIVQEWVEGETLHAALRDGSLTAADRRRIMHELTQAAAYLHRCGVVHRDIKPANVMIRKTGGEAVLVDFGLADSDDYIENKGAAGTPGFISPEQMESGGVSPTDDVYSLGVVMRELVPRYRAIADRCTDVAAKRPADASALLRLMLRRDRRPKILLTLLAGIVAVAVAALVTIRILDLQRVSDTSRRHLTMLREKNVENETLVAGLRDSLTEIRDRLASTTQELTQVKEIENIRQDFLNGGYRRIDKLLTEYDRGVFSKMTSDDYPIFSSTEIELMNKLKATVEDYSKSYRDDRLPPDDRDKLIMDLYNYISLNIAKYQDKWLKQINLSM